MRRKSAKLARRLANRFTIFLNKRGISIQARRLGESPDDMPWVGNLGWAVYLAVLGIRPETYDDKSVCSIGFCEREQKWYGWSHRAMYGFGVGDVVTDKNHICATSGWTQEYLEACPDENLSLPVGFEAKTLDDARRMAIAFADAVA